MAVTAVSSRNPPKNRPLPTRRRKTKTGCRTCKKRKIKCDEGWPACYCCVSTGRVCDGYGIWGGGGNRQEQGPCDNAPVAISKLDPNKIQIPKVRILRPPPATLVSYTSPKEQSYFDFFRHYTAGKLQIVLGPSFQETMLLQTSATEPAVLHAILALSAFHKRKETGHFSRDRSRTLPDEQERFALQQNSKAIYHLQPRLLPNARNPARTALIACLVFVFTEFVRGDYTTGCNHLQSGLKLIEMIKAERSPRVTLAPKAEKESLPGSGTLEGGLIFAFERVYKLVALTGQYTTQQRLPPSSLLTNLPSTKYKSPDEARFLLNEVFRGLKSVMKEFSVSQDPPEAWPIGYRELLSSDQHFIRGALDSWIGMYDATVADISERGIEDEVRQYAILRVYYIMATIMSATCLSVHKQMVFDEHMASFLAIVAESTTLVDSGERLEELNKPQLIGLDSMNSISDLGWTSPLYYTALKCRNRRNRRQAIKLLWSLHRSERSEYPLYLARVAAEVLHLEEKAFFAGTWEDTEIEWTSSWDDICEPAPLPEERRIEQVDAVILKDGSGGIELAYKSRSNAGWHIVRKMYDKSCGCWMYVAGGGCSGRVIASEAVKMSC